MNFDGNDRRGPDSPNGREGALAQIEQVEQQLQALKESLVPQPGDLIDEPPAATATRIRRVLKARRVRQDFFGEDLFADPAWDILLEAYASQLLQQRTSVTALCNAAAVPATTALRWVRKLEEEGLLDRRQDPLDARRSWVELSNGANAKMRRYLEAVSLTLPI